MPFLGVRIFEWLPMLAGLAMAMISATVVGNSMLLGRYRSKFAVTKPKTEQVYSEKAFKETYAPQT